jgi:hypothetical protein
MVQDKLLGVYREPRRSPFHQLVHERLGKTLGAVESSGQKAAEALFDVLEERSGRTGQRRELPCGVKTPSVTLSNRPRSVRNAVSKVPMGYRYQDLFSEFSTNIKERLL